MKKAVLVLLLAVAGAACFAADYINLVKSAYVENDNYTVEQIINALSYGKSEWTQSGRYVTVSCNLLEHIEHKLGPVKFTFSVSSDGNVKYESHTRVDGKVIKRSSLSNFKNAAKNVDRLLERRQMIYDIIQEVNQYIVYGEYGDVNGDGVANCQDFSFMFKLLWDKYNPKAKADCEIVANYSLLHAFNRVRIPYGVDLWEYIEPQARIGSFEIPDVWYSEGFDVSFNRYGDNMEGMYYPRNWSKVSKASSGQFSKYASIFKWFASAGAEISGSEWGFHGDLGMITKLQYFSSQLYFGPSYRRYDDEFSAWGIDLGLRLGAAFSFGDILLNPFAGFEIGWAFHNDDSTFNCAPQVGAIVAWKKFFVEAYYSFDMNVHKDGAFSFGLGYMF